MIDQSNSCHESANLVEACGVNYTYGSGHLKRNVLSDIHFVAKRGEITLLIGPSGSGKSTLLTLIGALRSCQNGSLKVLGEELLDINEASRIRLRRRIGFIFQSHNLVRALTAIENVELVLRLKSNDSIFRYNKAYEILNSVGLSEHVSSYPSQLSGGQRQRVAIARALAMEPALILADEPTASLDRSSGEEVIRMLSEMCYQRNAGAVLVTHDLRLEKYAKHIWRIEDGLISSCQAK